MKVNRIANNEQSFKGLYSKGLSQEHMNKIIAPIASNLEKLGDGADIYFTTRKYRNEKSMIEYAVRKFGDKEPLRWVHVGTEDNLLSAIEKSVSKIISKASKY